jgi:hypothetical protein
MSAPTRNLPIRVDLRLTAAERDRLTDEAKQYGISRQDLLRRRVLARENEPIEMPRKQPAFRRGGRATIDKAIRAAQRAHPGLPVQQLEPIVCSVICAIAPEE